MNVGRQTRGFIERANADEANGFAGAGIVAPYGDFAFWTPRNPLALAAVGRRVDDHDVARQQLHSIRFDHGIEGERGTRLSLAPAAVAAVNEQRFGRHPIANVAAGAAAVIKGTHCRCLAHAICLRAVTSISICIRGSDNPAEIIIAAGRTGPRYLRSTGQQSGKRAASGRT